MISDDQLETWFEYHAPSDEQVAAYEVIREVGRFFAQTIRNNTPESADQTAAIRKVREAVFTANCAVACGGK